ncbi:MAG: hypothetical protein ACFFEA_01290 [Candidatus Thorarchaeota archaeon]
MSSSWIIKTRQMSEAGKEIILREALAAHLRSTRDRQIFNEILPDPCPLDEILAAYAAFYLQSYQGVRLHTIEDTQNLSIEDQEKVGEDTRKQLENEVHHILGTKQREEVAIGKILSQFIIRFCEELGNRNPSDDETLKGTEDLIKEYLGMIPSEFSPNHDIDLLNQMTGYDVKLREDLYAKASGLKETAMSLREEVLREHDAEVIEITVLKEGLKRIWGAPKYASAHIVESMVYPATIRDIAKDVAIRLCKPSDELEVIKRAHEIRLNFLSAVEKLMTESISLDDYEKQLVDKVSDDVAKAIEANPTRAFNLLSYLVQIPSTDIAAALRRKGLSDPTDLAKGFRISEEAKSEDSATEAPTISEVEMDYLERSLKAIDKLENILERPVKGALKAQGLRASELEKFTIETLAKDRDSLIGYEVKVLEVLKEKTRVPSPEDVRRLLEAREKVKKGALSSIGVSSSSDIVRHRRHGETIEALRFDLVWHLTSGILTNISRVVETYIRSKQDLLRIKALLKSIYESPETDLQALREEILIDLASTRIYELKTIYPDLKAPDITSWMHARLSNKDMTAAKTELDSTPSPVFEGVIDTELVMDQLDFDNYAIAYDIMHRFLRAERRKKLAKEEFALEAKLEEQKVADSKKASIDVLTWIYTKSQTVFRAIGRVGVKGLEWNANDDSKCANLLSYYIRTSRGRKICSVCGETPAEGKCKTHGTSNMIPSNDTENLAIFVMRSITDIKQGLIGSTAKPMTLTEARSIVEREVRILRRSGKITGRTNLKELMPGDINYIFGPAISRVIGRYFNESLEYAARRVDFA